MKQIRWNKIIIFILIISVCGLYIYFVYQISEKNKIREKSQFLIFDNVYFWKFSDNEWSKLLNEDEYKEFNWLEYNVYVDNKFRGVYNYGVMMNDSYYYDKNNKIINFGDTSYKFLINHDSYIKNILYKKVRVDAIDKENVMKFLLNNNFKLTGDLSINKYVVDNKNSIYVVNNEISSVIFIKFKNKDYLLNYYDDLVADLAYIIDIGERCYNIILKYNCDQDICYNMWQYNKRKYTKVIDVAVTSDENYKK